MNILVACEFSGVVRDAFRKRGHQAWSCDLLPTTSANDDYHFEGDVFKFLEKKLPYLDLMIAHPPCTFLCSSGLHWNKRVPGRTEETEKALQFVRRLMGVPIPRIAIENPIGCISTRIKKPDQIIHPHQFGHDASKATCLWLKNLPLLNPTSNFPPRMVDGKPRWDNQTDSGQNKLAPSVDRWAKRSITYSGFADAFAEQWGCL